MNAKAIEAEVSIRSGIDAEVEVGRGITVNVADVTLESLEVTENGQYVPGAGVDGYDRVVVDVPPIEPPKDPNIVEGEFEGTRTGVLTIDLPYTGDSYPKAVFIYDAEGIIKDEVPRAYTITAYSALKNNAQEPTYDGDTANNGFRYQEVYTGTVTYTSGGGAATYIFSQTDPAMGTNGVKMPDSKTLKVYVTDVTASSAIRFRAGIRYKYQVFY